MTDQTIPPIPSFLARNERAAERWNELWTILERTRVNPIVHRDIVAQYCVAYADWREALEKLERSKLVAEKRTVGVGDKAKTTVEKVTVSPYYSIAQAAAKEMDRLGKMIGLDPLSPLEESRPYADYIDTIAIPEDDGLGEQEGIEGANADGGQPSDGAGSGDAAGTASEPGDDGDANRTGNQAEIQAGAADSAAVLDQGQAG
jgi:P27 family predicted phage terminase small subunit